MQFRDTCRIHKYLELHSICQTCRDIFENIATLCLESHVWDSSVESFGSYSEHIYDVSFRRYLKGLVAAFSIIFLALQGNNSRRHSGNIFLRSWKHTKCINVQKPIRNTFQEYNIVSSVRYKNKQWIFGNSFSFQTTDKITPQVCRNKFLDLIPGSVCNLFETRDKRDIHPGFGKCFRKIIPSISFPLLVFL
jgi:hypothetical protein